MKNSRILLTYHDLTVEVESSPGVELMEHMHQTVMGQPGGLQYHHTDLEERMKSGDENYFIYLRKSGKMLGSVGFCSKPTETAGLAHDSWLIRYFSIKAPFRAVPKKRKTKADLKDENKRTSVLGRFIQPFSADPSQLREGETRADQPAIIFAIIDQTNLRSMNFSVQMGLETVGSMAGFSFSRMQPRRSKRIETVEENQQAVILKQIREFYKEYTLFYSDSIFKNNDYYVIKEGGRMVAGVQIYPVDWKIVDFGSQLTNRAVRLLTRIPWVRKRIAPDKISFLAFDAIYCEPGFEKALYELMEGVLKRTGNYIAMMMMDLESDLYAIFRDRRKLGALHKIMGTSYADIRVRFIHMPDAVRQQFYDRPTYIPTYDNS
ncbi:MAG: hypothetical protein KAS82_07055 [Bacteroidales bacterium]|nr:hypothetical protein [Bacteroidales bacterium]